MSKDNNDFCPADLSRRRWLQYGGATLAGALGLGSLASLGQTSAHAQSSGYKALVCVFLFGGNDGMNMVVPMDTTRHDQYAGIRQDLALPRDALVPVTGTDFGLHPAMAALAQACSDGRLAPVFNVGPLGAPLTKSQYLTIHHSDPRLPDSLYSHSDQQILWQVAGARVLERTGWGGRASTTLGTTNPVISVTGNGHFGLSSLTAPLVLPEPGGTFGLAGYPSWDNRAWKNARRSAIDTMYASPDGNQLLNSFSQLQKDSHAFADRLGTIIAYRPGHAEMSAILDVSFAPLISGNRVQTAIGRQLYQVAKLIMYNATVGGSRQLFMAGQGGYDTHSEQVAGDSQSGQHARLLKDLADAMACFYDAMKRLGMSESVTLFTQSDFGRTFAPNSSSGTDHAWGNNHLVLGGAVRGGSTYGTYPVLELGGPSDVGNNSWNRYGRWIPTASVDQYAATLLSWFGASDAQLNAILPNLGNFGTARNLGFV